MMNKLVLFLLVGFALISLSAGNHHENELVETEKTDMMALENIETLELAKPDTMPKKKKDKKKNKKKKNKKNKKKGNKKNKKGRNKKNKKGRNKKNKKRRNKKNKKGRNKKGKTKKSKKGTNKKSKSKGRSGARANTACQTNINKYLYFLAKGVANLEKQIIRAERQKNVTLNKVGKKGDFAKALSSAQEAAGGNLSAPKCGSNLTSTGAINFKHILGNLSKCSENIKAACKPPKAPNATEISSCKKKINQYKWKMGNNTVNKTNLCGAFGDKDTKTKYDAVVACVSKKNTGNNMTFKQWAGNVTKAKNNCTKAFVKCRRSEREVGPNIQTCNKNKATILKSLNTLNKNNKSANTVKAKVKNLTSSSGRHNRAVPTTCTAVVVVVKLFTMKLTQNPESDVTSETTSISGIKIAVGTCKNDTTLSGLATTLDNIITAIKTKISILQTQLKTLTGTTASSSQIAAATTASSTASGRRKRASLLNILNKVNMD